MRNWWTYQRERFPLATHAPFAVVMAAACMGWSSLASGTPAPSWATVVAAGATTLMVLIQLRVSDEHKDYEDDLRHRPERPVPRGLVTLRALAGLAVAAGVAQAGLALLIEPWLLVTLGLVLAYLLLMAREFFAPSWLKARPVVYLLSHMAIVPILVVHLTAFDWLPSGLGPPRGLPVLAATAVLLAIAFEVGRKTLQPHEERPGVETYSRLWGAHAATAWLLVLVAAAFSGFWAAALVDAAVAGAVAGGAAALLAIAGWVAFRRGRTKWVTNATALATFIVYVGVGIVPWVMR